MAWHRLRTFHQKTTKRCVRQKVSLNNSVPRKFCLCGHSHSALISLRSQDTFLILKIVLGTDPIFVIIRVES